MAVPQMNASMQVHHVSFVPPRQPGHQLLDRCIGDHPQGRSDDRRKACQHRCLERLRLGQPRPVALAQSRIRQGFAAITAVSTSACSRGRSKPPVASITMSPGRGTWLNCEIRVVILALARG